MWIADRERAAQPTGLVTGRVWRTHDVMCIAAGKQDDVAAAEPVNRCVRVDRELELAALDQVQCAGAARRTVEPVVGEYATIRSPSSRTFLSS